MKLYAQHGFGDGEKVAAGLERGLIDGAILGAKDLQAEKLSAKLGDLRAASAGATLVFDPQFYVSLLRNNGALRLGALESYDYFRSWRRSQLESSERVAEVLDSALEFQAEIPELDALIAPNILISRSFDSAEAVIAKNFIRATANRHCQTGDPRPVFATLAVSREALLHTDEFESFLADITLLDEPPDGFYLLIGASSSEARGEILHADIIAAWMLLNRSLKLNGFEVINGYSDLLTPFLAAVGADAGATGWFNTLRVFSLERFGPAAGMARQPLPRYLSARLLNRLTFVEMNAMRTMFPAVLNRLPTDASFPRDDEPERIAEAFQAWEALRTMSAAMSGGDISANLAACELAVAEARNAYGTIAAAGFRLGPKSGGDHIAEIHEGLTAFRESAEL